MLEVVVVVRRALIAAVTVLALAPAAASAQAPCTKTYVSGAWNAATSWSPTGLPGAGDVVCIGPAATELVANATVDVRAIRSERPLRNTAAMTLNDPAEPSTFTALTTGAAFTAAADIEAGSVTITSATSIAGDVVADAVRIQSAFTLGGDLETTTLTHVSGLMSGDGDVRAETMVWNGGQLAGAGTTTVSSRHEFLGNLSGLQLRSGRKLVTHGTGLWSGNMTAFGEAVWTNHAAVTITGGSLGGTVENGARPELRNAPGGAIVRAAGNYSMSGVAVDNDGLIEATANAITINQAAGVSSGRFVGISLAAEPLRVGADAVIERMSVSGVLILPDDTTFEIADLTISGGEILGRTTLVLRGHFWAYYGQVGAGGMTMILPTGATMEWTHAFGLYAKRFESYGDVTVTETGLGRPNTTWGSRTVWENFGRITLVSGLFPTLPDDEAARIVNHGTITKTGTGTITIRPVIVNDGVVDIQRGQITATRFEQSSNGTLRFDIGGTGNNEFGRLSAGAFLYSGRLEATRPAGFTPAPGTRWTVVAATQANRSGLFHAVATPGFALDEAAASGLALVAAAASVAPGTPGVAAAPAASADPGTAAPATPTAPGTAAPAAPAAGVLPAAGTAGALSAAPAAALDAAATPARPAATTSLAGATSRSAGRRVSSAVRLAVADRRVRLRAGRTRSLRAPAAARVRLVGHSRGVRVQRVGRALRVTRLGGGRQTLRYRLVGADGTRSRVVTLTLRS